MLDKIKDFYINYSSAFTERFFKYNAHFLFCKYVNDFYSNIAIINESSNLELINSEFKKRNLETTFYTFKEPQKNCKILYSDNYLYLDKIESLYLKYKKFKSKDIYLIEVNNENLQKEYMEINDLCYSSNSYDNPYSNLDNFGYCKAVLDFQRNEIETKTLIYIIKYKDKNVGCINLTIKENLCYISGLAILEEFRKTKVFFSMIDILEILIKEKVNTVFCITELDEYPDKLYKKLGFKSVGIGYAFKTTSN